jgi:hypothetical protein
LPASLPVIAEEIQRQRMRLRHLARPPVGEYRFANTLRTVATYDVF